MAIVLYIRFVLSKIISHHLVEGTGTYTALIWKFKSRTIPYRYLPPQLSNQAVIFWSKVYNNWTAGMGTTNEPNTRTFVCNSLRIGNAHMGQ